MDIVDQAASCSDVSGSTALVPSQCPNCHQHIQRNFLTHQAVCVRNLKFCEECAEPVGLSDLEEHIRSHELISCAECRRSTQRRFVEMHLSFECCSSLGLRQEATTLDLRGCQYCLLEFDRDHLEGHLARCGARTDCCPECQQYIQLRHLDKHLATRCNYPRSESSSSVVLGDYLTTGPEEGPIEYDTMGGQIRATWMDDELLQEEEEAAVMIPCECCGEYIPGDDYSEHYSSCDDPLQRHSHKFHASLLY